jgi:acetoin utilization deacetylase AcuC-like enzyme
MPKFGLLCEYLLKEGVITPEQIYQPGEPPQEWIEYVHETAYVNAYRQGTLDAKAQRRIGLPWSPALVKRTCTAVGGTILTAKLALKHGLACNTAGGHPSRLSRLWSGVLHFQRPGHCG